MELDVQFWHLSCKLIQCLYITAYVLELQWCCTMSLSATQALWSMFFSLHQKHWNFKSKFLATFSFFFFLFHLLWLLAVPDLEGSMHLTPSVTSYNWTGHDKLSSALFFPFQLTSTYLNVSKNIERVQLQIRIDNYWQDRSNCWY